MIAVLKKVIKYVFKVENVLWDSLRDTLHGDFHLCLPASSQPLPLLINYSCLLVNYSCRCCGRVAERRGPRTNGRGSIPSPQ